MEGQWGPLFRMLGWRKNRYFYTDGDGRFYGNFYAPSFALEERIGEAWDSRYESSPSGLKVPVYTKKILSERKYILNHVAVNVSDLEAEQKWWQALLNAEPALSVKQGWDPIINGPLDAIHFYKSPFFYITLRGQEPVGLHHIGFEARDKGAVLDAKEILKKIDWEIYWEGAIDESYVLHFKGPDGRIHDFFSASDELRER